MREIKFRAWDGIDMEYFHDLYWFEENQVRSSNDYKYKIMQFIGVRDKNGKEIYEGDILQFDQTSVKVFRRVVTFHEGCFGYRDLTGAWCSPIKGIEWEVIGNIHENGDLLK